MYVVDVPVAGDDDRLLIEIRDVDEGLVDVARPGQVVARGVRSLQDMLQTVRPVADSFVHPSSSEGVPVFRRGGNPILGPAARSAAASLRNASRAARAQSGRFWFSM
jgi:hypothetical protein